MNHLFITGSARSGTTLLCGLLNSHPELQVYSQPFPLLFVASKQRFHQSIDYSGKWLPLANYGTGTDYRPDDVDLFLNKDIIDKNTLSNVFERSEMYSGTKTRLIPDLNTLKEGSFSQLFTQLVTQQPNAEVVTYTGSKEILCEEFIHHFLHGKIRCICIVRDPRDILSSMNHGRGQAFTGEIRPTLFNIHNWRKSVHSCIHYQSHPEFMFLKYESLVNAPQHELQQLTHFLGITSFSDLKNEYKTGLSSNSSFGDYSTVSNKSVGRHRVTLSRAVTEYIEATCYAEMAYLGYSPSIYPNPEKMSDIVDSFTEPYDLQRDCPSPDYSRQPSHIATEKQRINYFFTQSVPPPPAGMFPEVQPILKAALTAQRI